MNGSSSTSVSGETSCYALYNMSAQRTIKYVIHSDTLHTMFHHPCVNMYFEPIPLHNYEQIAIHCDKVTLSVKDIILILSETWFNDRIIDSYYTLLSTHLNHKLFVYNCVWFSNKLFTNKDADMPKIFFNNRGSTFLLWITEQAGTNYDFIIMLMSFLR